MLFGLCEKRHAQTGKKGPILLTSNRQPLVGDCSLCGGNMVSLQVVHSTGLQNQDFRALAVVDLTLDLEDDCIEKGPVKGAQIRA